MTDQHPLTDEICADIVKVNYSLPESSYCEDMRVAADWQLEQCIAWLDDTDCDDPQETAQRLREAMRPEVVDLPQANSDVCGEEGMERALQRTFEENDELMRKLSDSQGGQLMTEQHPLTDEMLQELVGAGLVGSIYIRGYMRNAYDLGFKAGIKVSERCMTDQHPLTDEICERIVQYACYAEAERIIDQRCRARFLYPHSHRPLMTHPLTDDSRETTITKEQLDRLWNALEYTLGTISDGCLFESESNPEYVEIHRGRAVQSRRFLTNAKSTVNELLKETDD